MSHKLLLALSIFALAHGPSKAELTLVREGRATAKIVLPMETEFYRESAAMSEWLTKEIKIRNGHLQPDAFKKFEGQQIKSLENSLKAVGDEEDFAAKELQSIIEKISGARLEIIRAKPDEIPEGPSILIGSELARARRLGDDLDAVDRDGLICRQTGNHLILSGRRARGTLYAVYSFLESLGCRWVMPGPFGELYPSLKTISTSINRTENPSHSQRYFWCTYGHAKEYPLWTLRNKGNFKPALGDKRVHQGHALSQALNWGPSQEKYRIRAVRSKTKWVKNADGKRVRETVTEEIWTLPDEFYARKNGKLSFHIPNMSLPKVWDLYADYYVNYFNTRPLEDYASASAEDGLVSDERPETRKLDSLEFDHFMGAFTATDRLWFFLNRIIERVEKVYPTKKFGVLVYSNNLTPPRMERLHKNMALVFAPLGVSPLHHVRDPKSKTNRAYREWLEDWMLMAKAAGAETYYYDYEPLGYCWNMALICPRWGIIGKNYPWFHKLGLDGHTSQGYDDWAACGLNNYLMQRLYWDASLNYKDVIKDYSQARFGAAATTMIQYYEALEKRMAEIPDLYSNEVWDNHLILTPAVRQKCRKLLEKAMSKAKSPRAMQHLETMRDLQRSTDAVCDAIEFAHETGDFGKAAEMMKVCFEVRDKLKKHYDNFMSAKRLDDKARPQYFTGGIYNQYLHFDKKIKESAVSLVLPRHWKGSLDTRNHAQSLGYHKPEVSVAHLESQDVTVCPDVKHGTHREPAGFFYRTEIQIPDSFKGKKVSILFASLIARGLQVWINGESVQFDAGTYKSDVWRGPETFWYNYNHEEEFDVTPYIRPGEMNTIAFRVYKGFDFGGTYRRIFLLGN